MRVTSSRRRYTSVVVTELCPNRSRSTISGSALARYNANAASVSVSATSFAACW